MQKLVGVLILLLLILHQDVWFWRDGRLVFGFLPIGLFFHAMISIAASGVWLLATRYCWPSELTNSELADEGEASS